MAPDLIEDEVPSDELYVFTTQSLSPQLEMLVLLQLLIENPVMFDLLIHHMLEHSGD